MACMTPIISIAPPHRTPRVQAKARGEICMTYDINFWTAEAVIITAITTAETHNSNLIQPLGKMDFGVRFTLRYIVQKAITGNMIACARPPIMTINTGDSSHMKYIEGMNSKITTKMRVAFRRRV